MLVPCAAGGLQPIIKMLGNSDIPLVRRCLIALYNIGAEKEHLQTDILTAGGVPPALRLCRSRHAEVQSEAMDVMKMLARHPVAGGFIVGAGMPLYMRLYDVKIRVLEWILKGPGGAGSTHFAVVEC